MMILAICSTIIALAAVLLVLPALKSWRTVIFNTVVVVVGGVLPILGETVGFLRELDWAQYVPEDAVPWVVLVIGILGIVLRYVTTGPVGKRS